MSQFVFSDVYTPYIELIDDLKPVVGVYLSTGDVFPLDILSIFSQSQIDDLKSRFRMISRLDFNEIVKNIVEPIMSPKENILSSVDLRKAVTSNLLEMFNAANLAVLQAEGITDPWLWEQKKIEAKYYAQAEADYLAQNTDIEASFNLLTIDQELGLQKRADLEQRASKLPAISDPALQIQRGIAIKFLLDKGSLPTAEAVIQYYEGASEELNNVLTTQI